MEIKKLTLNNIRSYVGKHELVFSTNPDRNVTLVHGVNGSGKTGLFIALNWVIFGSDFPYAGKLVSDRIAPENSTASSVTASVALDFSHNGNDYFLSRSIRAERLPNGFLNERITGIDLYVIDHAGQSKQERFPETTLKSIFPGAIRSFFFFDGDKISDFTKAGRERDLEITKAVNDVLQLDLVERSGKHLSSIAREIERSIAKHGSPKIRELEFERAQVEEKFAFGKTDLQRLRDELRVAESRLVDIDEKLKAVNIVSEKAKRREILDKNFLQAKTEIVKSKVNLMRGTVTFAPSMVLMNLEKAEKFLDSKRRKREIPGNYKEQFLKDIIAAKRCICERSIEPNSIELECIESLLGVILPGSVQERAIDLSGAIRRIRKNQDGSMAALVSLERSVVEAQEAANQIEHELKTLTAEIGNINVAEVELLELDRVQTKSAVQLRLINESKTVTLLIDLGTQLDDLKKRFSTEAAKEERHARLVQQSEFASRSAQAFVRIREQLIADLRGDMGEEATEIFKKFTWKKDYFSHVEVGDDYLIKMNSVKGDDLRAGMSMGETQLLSLAFMLSMISISEYQAPLVIDTPLARLSLEVRQNLLNTLPRLTKQLVLLCTDTEMDSVARDALGATVGAECRLKFFDGITSIEEGALA